MSDIFQIYNDNLKTILNSLTTEIEKLESNSSNLVKCKIKTESKLNEIQKGFTNADQIVN